MNNINIEIEKDSRMIKWISKRVLGNDGENLQENLVFSFDKFVDGQARLELIMPDETNSYLMLDKIDETYQIPVKSIMTKQGRIYMQLVVTEGTDEEEIPIFKSNMFYVLVKESINAETGSPEPYIEWIDRANIKLNQIDNLDISATKEEHTTTITITKKDGTTESVEILDGEDGKDGSDGVGLDYNWQGTSLGIKREDEQGYEYVNLKGDTGPAGAIKMLIVNQLPTTGEEGTLYFVPKQDTETSDIYDEYMWVNNNWERLGEKQIQVDLTDYVKNTDYMTSSKGGVAKTGNGFDVNSSGVPSASSWNYTQYSGQVNVAFISKGTLENVLNARIGDISSVLDAINGEVI